MSHAERTSTLRSGYEPLGGELVLGSRAVACWNNATEDFGLQMSDMPARCESRYRLHVITNQALSFFLRQKKTVHVRANAQIYTKLNCTTITRGDLNREMTRPTYLQLWKVLDGSAC